MKNRRYGRALTLQALYCWTITHPPLEELLQFRWLEIETLPPGNGTMQSSSICNFAAELIQGVINNIAQIDKAISEAATHWDIDRMLIVDRSLLRIGSYEILYRNDIPPAATLNEMIELARCYSGDNSPRFVNGILDRVYTNRLS